MDEAERIARLNPMAPAQWEEQMPFLGQEEALRRQEAEMVRVHAQAERTRQAMLEWRVAQDLAEIDLELERKALGLPDQDIDEVLGFHPATGQIVSLSSFKVGDVITIHGRTFTVTGVVGNGVSIKMDRQTFQSIYDDANRQTTPNSLSKLTRPKVSAKQFRGYVTGRKQGKTSWKAQMVAWPDQPCRAFGRGPQLRMRNERCTDMTDQPAPSRTPSARFAARSNRSCSGSPSARNATR